MGQSGIWQVFSETGDPLCYLLFKAESKTDTGESAPAESKVEGGQTPAPSLPVAIAPDNGYFTAR